MHAGPACVQRRVARGQAVLSAPSVCSGCVDWAAAELCVAVGVRLEALPPVAVALWDGILACREVSLTLHVGGVMSADAGRVTLFAGSSTFCSAPAPAAGAHSRNLLCCSCCTGCMSRTHLLLQPSAAFVSTPCCRCCGHHLLALCQSSFCCSCCWGRSCNLSCCCLCCPCLHPLLQMRWASWMGPMRVPLPG